MNYDHTFHDEDSHAIIGARLLSISACGKHVVLHFEGGRVIECTPSGTEQRGDADHRAPLNERAPAHGRLSFGDHLTKVKIGDWPEVVVSRDAAEGEPWPFPSSAPAGERHRARHYPEGEGGPLAWIKAWRGGCSVSHEVGDTGQGPDPSRCQECTSALIDAIDRYLREHGQPITSTLEERETSRATKTITVGNRSVSATVEGVMNPAEAGVYLRYLLGEHEFTDRPSRLIVVHDSIEESGSLLDLDELHAFVDEVGPYLPDGVSISIRDASAENVRPMQIAACETENLAAKALWAAWPWSASEADLFDALASYGAGETMRGDIRSALYRLHDRGYAEKIPLGDMPPAWRAVPPVDDVGAEVVTGRNPDTSECCRRMPCERPGLGPCDLRAQIKGKPEKRDFSPPPGEVYFPEGYDERELLSSPIANIDACTGDGGKHVRLTLANGYQVWTDGGVTIIAPNSSAEGVR